MKWFGLIVLLLVVGAGWYGYNYWVKVSAAMAAAAEAAVVTAKVEKRDVEQLVRGRGEIKAPLTTEVKSEVNGRVTRVTVIAGTMVRKGDVLVELDKAELESQINEATHQIEASELRAEKMRRNLGREQRLLDARLVPQKQFDDLRIDTQLALNELKIYSARLETLRQQLAKTTIMAPRDGMVLKIDVQEGMVIIGAGSVSSGTSLMSVADLRQLEVNADLDEIDVAKLGVGMPVKLTLDSIPDLKLEGNIKFISPLAVTRETDKSIHVFPIIITFVTDDKRVKVGLTANVSISITRVENALALPISMVFSNEKSSYVYVKDQGKIAKKEVQTGISDNLYVEIKSGLSEGEVVSLNPAGEPKDKPGSRR
ncbi:MAG: efflux RND transporter periplasmic adaptor subunit [Candidatus Methylacidiphilales bacterium]|nr:efflux RND transporter periplasmic adaptor subunit [Candidatus Methylacidiphilales bacterium]